MKGGMLSARKLAISGRGTRMPSKLSFPDANSGASLIVGKSSANQPLILFARRC
jgi:hypothetical protein